MSQIWPHDVHQNSLKAAQNPIRPFKTLLLMPFESRFDDVAKIIHDTVEQVAKSETFGSYFSMPRAEIKRIDWITSSGVIQNEIWLEIASADLVFCDITGYNPNVMVEAGVCAAWKRISQLVFIKDKFFKQVSAFDIAPIRYTEYEMTSNGVSTFASAIAGLTREALLSFPDSEGTAPNIPSPLDLRFRGNHDSPMLYTPPYSHRRVANGDFEFGSTFFSHSWASLGKEKYLNFSLDFEAKFVPPTRSDGFIGVAVHSQHFFANFSNVIYLKADGQIIITLPHDNPPKYYEDKNLRGPTDIDTSVLHQFRIVYAKDKLKVTIDDFSWDSPISDLKKQLGAGLIRFQAWNSRMAINNLQFRAI
jgi:hypothetical protein